MIQKLLIFLIHDTSLRRKIAIRPLLQGVIDQKASTSQQPHKIFHLRQYKKVSKCCCKRWRKALSDCQWFCQRRIYMSSPQKNEWTKPRLSPLFSNNERWSNWDGKEHSGPFCRYNSTIEHSWLMSHVMTPMQSRSCLHKPWFSSNTCCC